MSIHDGIKITEATAAVIIAVPDLEGNIAEYKQLIEQAHAHKALAIVFTDPLLLAAIEAPGKYGADLVVGEGQPLGIPQFLGGPGLGFFAATNALLRFMPGRIVGKTIDSRGQEAYVLTMQTREQHIRREKATSNICSNQALCALMATVYMSTMGPTGMKQVVSLCQERVEYARDKIAAIPGFIIETKGPLFREFVVQCPEEVAVIGHKLFEKGIIGGYDLGNKRMLVCCTEMTTTAQIDAFAIALSRAVKVYA
jgi:glycine dehydrogenase subunit 1